MSNVKFRSPSPKVSVETSYRGIGVSHHGSAETCQERAQRTLVLHSAETDFHCHKKQGRKFHMVTASNSSGEPVVQYFGGQTDEQPDACGSFVRLK